jgi:hypothetical protein
MLLQAGYDSPAKVADAEIADLSVLPGMDQDKAERTIAAARLTAVTGVSTDEEAPQEPAASSEEVAADTVAADTEEVKTEADVKE